MKLSKLIKTTKVKRFTSPNSEGGRQSSENKEQSDIQDLEIGSIHYRAQDVKPGGMFVAIHGFLADGHDFIDEALARGASAIVTQKPVNYDSIVIEVENTRKALAALSARFFGNPSENLFIIGITGTNGKTTTAVLIENILLKAGYKVGVSGTLNYRYSGKTFRNPMTTPESLDLQRILAEMLEDGITHVVVEVSSHAIDLFRVNNCWIDVGVFTNLSQDHLDYHGNMSSYWSCKKKLFAENLRSGPKKGRTVSVINCNDKRAKELLKIDSVSSLTTGHSNDNMIRPNNIKYDLSGIRGEILTPGGAFEFESPLIGKHNLENILCAGGVGVALKFPLNAIKSGIEEVSHVPGRLESIPNDIDRFVYIDYAHTPDALKNVLTSLRSLAAGRIICVFGCGGDRDRDKRPQMGEMAGRICDLVIITSDNPRTEAPIEIIEQIAAGTKKVSSYLYEQSDLKTGLHKKGYVIEPDREKAIRLGITASRPGDTVLIAGKGNETYQIIGSKTLPFDDRKEAEMALWELKALLKTDEKTAATDTMDYC